MKVHLPSLVENEILKEDGSIIKRFGLAWGNALPTNIIQTVSNVRKGQSPSELLTVISDKAQIRHECVAPTMSTDAFKLILRHSNIQFDFLDSSKLPV